MAAYTTIDDPEAYFQAKTWSGDGTAIGSGGQVITLDGDTNMQPDMVYIKRRNGTSAGQIHDAVRGATKFLPMDGSTDAEETSAETLTTFSSDGFTVGDHNGVNNSASTYIAWCWKESATSGFDIVTYTGNTTSGQTYSHSLSAVPHVMWVRCRNNADNMMVYHHEVAASSPETYWSQLNTTAASSTSGGTGIWNDTAPTSSVFTLGNSGTVNENYNYVAYLWSEKQGFSKFGSYTGNGDNDGVFVYTGFSPAWVLIKKSGASGTSWVMFDNKRNTYNERSIILQANDTGAEETSTNRIDFCSNGFKLRGTWTVINADSARYMYMAFADAPFVNSNGVPVTAI